MIPWSFEKQSEDVFYANLRVLNEYAGLCSKIMGGSGCLLGVSILCNIGGA